MLTAYAYHFYPTNTNQVFLGTSRIWIVGSSIIKRAATCAFTRPGGLNLNLHDTSIWWQGYSGMKLQDLVPKLRSLLRYEDPPTYLIIHCGANNVGQTPIERLVQILINTLLEICALFPASSIVWSSSLPRFSWRFSSNVKAMNQARARMDREAIRFLSVRGGHHIKHTQFNVKPPHLYHGDGVHLSQLGNDLLLNNYQGAIQYFMDGGGIGFPA